MVLRESGCVEASGLQNRTTSVSQGRAATAATVLFNLTGEAASNRHSAHRPGALLSLGFRFAEIEATIACTALGLDPSMGVLHADRAKRPAFVLDLMETARGLVEQVG